MASQHTTPTHAEQQQQDWKEAEDHELVTDLEDDEANAMAEFLEREWREIARKIVEVEQQRKVEEARAEVQKRKEVSSERSVRFSVLMRGLHDRHAELKRLVRWRKRKRRQPAKWRSVRRSWRGNAQRLRGRQESKRCKRRIQGAEGAGAAAEVTSVSRGHCGHTR